MARASMKLLLLLLVALLLGCFVRPTFSASASSTTLLFVTTDSQSNDLVAAARKGSGAAVKTFTSVAAALAQATEGDGVLVMADGLRPADPGVPQKNTTVVVTPAEWSAFHAKKLKAYVEFPRAAPGETQPLAVGQTLWERVAVSEPAGLGPGLPYLALLHAHKKVDYVKLPPSWLAKQTSLVIAKVAGFDNATFGLPDRTSNTSGPFPLLAVPTPDVMVAATQLSHCRLRRFAPQERWMAVAVHILSFVSSGAWQHPVGALWVPSVTASYKRDETLPPDAELQALNRGVQFYRNARLLPTYQRAVSLTSINQDHNQSGADKRAAYARLSPPFDAPLSGDGQLGVFEGLTSDISVNGKQPQSNGMRCDCVTETSASFAVRSVVTGNASDVVVATNLLNYGHLHAGYSQPWAVGAGTADGRPWVVSGDTFGLMSWTTSNNAYDLFYKDDDARGLLGAIATAGLLKQERWHSTITTATLANLRAASKNGFGPSSGGFSTLVGADLSPEEGWRKVYDTQGSPNYSPHYVSYIWAVYLWGYHVSDFPPLLERAQTALEIMMTGYPQKWVPTSNGIAMQRARILLPLAFLVRVNDTALHREWLQTAVDGFLTRQHCEGTWCAFKEELSHSGWAKGTRVPNNEDYGTFEAPLNQENDDPVSDFLYTSNFALLGLHEAAAALDDPKIKAVEDKLADFIIRIQARSTEHPDLDGAFFRAFDYEKWEAWASDADIGWGAWSVESGWTQSWITITLGMRLLNTTLWDLGSSLEPTIRPDFASWTPVMFPPPPPPPPPKPCTPPTPCLQAGKNTTLYYSLVNSVEQLCAPQNGSGTVTTIFRGVRCGAAASKTIQWQAMHTVNPRPGEQPSNCEWTEPPGSPFVGGCGSCATMVRLPTHVC